MPIFVHFHALDQQQTISDLEHRGIFGRWTEVIAASQKISSYLMLAAGAFFVLAALSAIIRFGFHITSLLTLGGGGLVGMTVMISFFIIVSLLND